MAESAQKSKRQTVIRKLNQQQPQTKDKQAQSRKLLTEDSALTNLTEHDGKDEIGNFRGSRMPEHGDPTDTSDIQVTENGIKVSHSP